MIVDMIKLRRQIHQNPELGFEEYATAELVENVLRKLNIETHRIAETGVIGLINNNKKKTILFRADMDALSGFQEPDRLDFASKTPGKMHACGHDVHTAMLLGTAEKLMAVRNDLDCNVKLVFQPAEEGRGGAGKLIAAGVLKNPEVHAALAFHVWPEFRAGETGIKKGYLTASSDEFIITITGKEGHVAFDGLTVNPIFSAGFFIDSIYPKYGPDFTVNITNIKAGESGVGFGGNSTVPKYCCFSGVIRAASQDKREQLFFEMLELLQKTKDKFGVECSIQPKIKLDYSPMYNDPMLTEQTEASAEKFSKIIHLKKPYLIGEDFASFPKHNISSTLILLGCTPKNWSIEKATSNNLHTSEFFVDESIMEIGSNIFLDFALNFKS